MWGRVKSRNNYQKMLLSETANTQERALPAKNSKEVKEIKSRQQVDTQNS